MTPTNWRVRWYGCTGANYYVSSFIVEKFLIGLHITAGFAAIGLVLLQQKGVGLGSAFGGEGTFYRARRGAEKLVFWLTAITTFLFIISAFLIDNYF